jgi:hypothetical protein
VTAPHALLVAAALAAGAAPSPPPGVEGSVAPALAAERASGAAPRATEADRRLLAEILARPEYRREGTDPAALRRAVAELWARALELLGTAEAERWASAGRALFLAAAAGAAALGFAALRRRGRGRRRARAAASPAAGAAEPRLAASPADAEAALRAGDLREAVRQALLAALAALERAGRLPAGRAKTNAEIAREVEGEASAATSTRPPLTFLARLFDRTFYGGLPVAADEAEGAVRAARRVASGEAGR